MCAYDPRDGAVLVRLGTIVKPHGLRGDLKIRVYNAELSALPSLHRLFLSKHGQTREYRVSQISRVRGDLFRLRLVEVNDITSAQSLVKADIFAAAEDLPKTGEGEFYYFEVIGWQVRTITGAFLGFIESTFFNGAHDVWVVKGNDKEILLPVVKEIVKSIDSRERVATVELIPGLID